MDTPTLCVRAKCGNLAVAYPIIVIPPEGGPVNGDPLRAPLESLKLCEHHLRKFTPSEFLLPHIKVRLQRAQKQSKATPPDFKNVTVERHNLF